MELNDIPNVAKKETANDVYRSFQEKVDLLKQKHSLKTPLLSKFCCPIYQAENALNALFAAINATASYAGLYLIDGFVIFLTRKQHSTHKGYMLA